MLEIAKFLVVRGWNSPENIVGSLDTDILLVLIFFVWIIFETDIVD